MDPETQRRELPWESHSDQRDRTLSLIRLLYQESDEDHPFTTQQIVQRLTQAGISAERKSVYRDLAAMNQHGFPVAYRRGAGWYAAGQPFTLAELQGWWTRWRYTADALGVAGGPVGETDRPGPPAPAETALPARWPLEPPRGEAPTGSAPCWTGSMRRCSASTPFASFPITYNNQAPGAWGGLPGHPQGMLWSQERHQLLGWNHQTRKLTLYRPDRMHQVEVTDVPAQGPEADLSQWLPRPSGRISGCRPRCACGAAPAWPGRSGPLGQGGHPGPGARRVYGDRPAGAGARFLGLAGRQGEKVTLLSPTWAVRVWEENYRPRGEWAATTWKDRAAL